jgi:2'-5' RNA ligase
VSDAPVRRLFLGLRLEGPARGAAEAALSQVRACASGPAWRVRPVVAADLHATVLFLGDLPAPAAPRVAAALDALARLDDVRALAGAPLVFGRLEAMPERGAPRLVWLRATEGEDALACLSERAALALRAAGVDVAPTVHRGFRGHVTLARLARAPADARALLAGLAPPPARQALDHLALFETLPPAARSASAEGVARDAAHYAERCRVALEPLPARAPSVQHATARTLPHASMHAGPSAPPSVVPR